MDLSFDGDFLVVHLTPGQKFFSFHRDLWVPLTSIVRVRANLDPWLDLRGWRTTGVSFQGKTAMGTRRHGEGRDFVFLTKEGHAVDLDMATGPYSRVTLSVDDAAAWVVQIAAAAGIAPGD